MRTQATREQTKERQLYAQWSQLSPRDREFTPAVEYIDARPKEQRQ